MINFPANEPPADEYTNHFVTPPATCFRWWIPGLPPDIKLMVGGSVATTEQWERLVKDFSITHCLNVDARGIEVPVDRMRHVPTPDNGLPIAGALLAEACRYAQQVLAGGGHLYVSDLMGATRAPAFAYAILRGALDKRSLSHEDALFAINRGFPHSTGYHWGYNNAARAYIGSIDLWIDEGGLRE